MTEVEENDLIWRLRHPLWQHYNNDPPQLEKDATQADLAEAADQIEALCSSLKEMLAVYWGEGDGQEPVPGCIQRAQAALISNQ